MLEEKARELGRIIGQSAEYQAVKRANEAINEDREAVSVLRQMEQIRNDAGKLIERGEEPPATMEQQLNDLFATVQTNPAYQRLVVAQENFDKVMYQVNTWITEGIKKGSTSSIITLG